ncbi:MAG: glycosyltransferase [Opitutales bacterium]|nr:glycosyltransferase [Opitutales bacterium]
MDDKSKSTEVREDKFEENAALKHALQRLTANTSLLKNHTEHLLFENKRLEQLYTSEINKRRSYQKNLFWPLAKLLLSLGKGPQEALKLIPIEQKNEAKRLLPTFAKTHRNLVVVKYQISLTQTSEYDYAVRIGKTFCSTQKMDQKEGTLIIGAELRIGLGLRLVELVRRPKSDLQQKYTTVASHYIHRSKEPSSWLPFTELDSSFTAKIELDLGRKVGKKSINLPSEIEPAISICIPGYLLADMTLSCVDSIQRNSKQSLEVIISDDSPDNSLAKHFPPESGVRFYKNEGDAGFVNNCNNAAKHARGKYIVFLNNDTVVQPNWDAELVQTLEENPDIGLTGSALIYPDGSLQESGSIIWDDASGWNFGRNNDSDKAEYSFLRDTDYCSAAAVMLSRELFEKIGGFDTRFCPAYYEDTDLSFAVRHLGFRTVVNPRSRVVHFEGKSNGTDESSGLKQYQRLNKEKFAKKWAQVLEDKNPKHGADLWHSKWGAARNQKSALVIDHHVPFIDQDAGSRSTFQYIQLLKDLGYRITFIGDNFYPHQPYTDTLQRMGVEVLHGDYYSLNIMTWLTERADQFDLVFTNRSHITVKYLEVLQLIRDQGGKVLYYGHDLGSVRNERAYAITQDPADLKNAKMDLENEKLIFPDVDAVYFPSYLETRYIQEHYREVNAITLPLNILDPRKNTYIQNLDTRSDIMFVGGFGHHPNEDAVLWFVKNCWNLIKEKLPELHFYIVGSKPSEAVQALAKDPSITVTGWISDEKLAEFYDKIRLIIVPLRYGAGVKGKVVEALQASIPTVLTPIAAEGIAGIETCTKIKDSAEEFGLEITTLYQDEKDLQSLSEKCAQVVSENFSQESAHKAIELGLQ